MFRLFRRLFNLFRRRRPPTPPALPESSATPTDGAASSSSPATPSPAAPSPATLESTVPTPIPPDRRSPEMVRFDDFLAASQPTPDKKVPLDSLKQVLNVLRAYSVTFGRPETPLELRSVIGAIVANLTTVNVENRRLEAFMDEAIAAFDSLGMESSLVDVTSQMLAEQVSVWLSEQETTVRNVVSAYLQQFAPEDVDWNSTNLLGLVQTVVAALNDGSLSKSGGRSLIRRVLETFELDQALSRWVAPEWVAMAQRIASYLDKEDLQTELQSIAWSYIQQFQAILSPQLIEQIMERGPINVSPAELLSGDLTDFSRMLFYKFQILEADPAVTKSHIAIAADVHNAIEAFKEQRGPGVDVTEGIEGDLEISSPFFKPKK